MRMLKTMVVIVAVVVLSGPLSVHASIIYNWTGDCLAVCVGQATLHVELSNAYTPGQELGEFQQAHPDLPPVLLALRYADNGLVFDPFHSGASIDYFLRLPAQPSDAAGFITFMAQAFRSNADGTWRFNGEFAFPGGCEPVPNGFCQHPATGINGVWALTQTPSAVPGPLPLLLLGVGLAGLAFLPRRKMS